jgi:exosortase A-associated hydrolase 2
MNKCRRMFADAGRALASRGRLVVMPDLSGTGDSGGEFRDASWQVWVDDLERVFVDLSDKGLAPTEIVAARLGCALAVDWAREASRTIERAVFWQPVLDGQRYLKQFLRLRLAAAMAGGLAKETVDSLMQQLDRGGVVEVAGYEISSTLARELIGVRITGSIPPRFRQVAWIDVSTAVEGAVGPMTESTARAWREAGLRVSIESCQGEPFWAATETVMVPALIDRTIDLLASTAFTSVD